MKKMYAIESGEYSDYRVHAVCETQETAEAWCSAMNSDPDRGWNRYTWFEINVVEPTDEIKKITTYTRVITLWDDGTTSQPCESCRSEYPVDMLWGMPPRRPKVDFIRAPMHNGKGGRLEIRGASKSAVDKVYSKRLASWSAGLWNPLEEYSK